MHSLDWTRLRDQVSPSTLRFAAASLALLVMLVLLLYALKPAWKSHGQVSAELAELRAEPAAHGPAAGAGRQLTTLEASVARLEARLRGESQGARVRDLGTRVLGVLDRASERHSVALLAVKPRAVATESVFQVLPYEVDVSGDYFSLYAWLRDVERELRPMVVREFSFSPAREAVQLELSLVAYRLLEDAA